VIPSAWIPLGVLVGEHRTLGLQHRPAHIVLRSYQLDLLALPPLLVLDSLPYLRVNLMERQIGWPGFCGPVLCILGNGCLHSWCSWFVLRTAYCLSLIRTAE